MWIGYKSFSQTDVHKFSRGEASTLGTYYLDVIGLNIRTCLCHTFNSDLPSLELELAAELGFQVRQPPESIDVRINIELDFTGLKQEQNSCQHLVATVHQPRKEK